MPQRWQRAKHALDETSLPRSQNGHTRRCALEAARDIAFIVFLSPVVYALPRRARRHLPRPGPLREFPFRARPRPDPRRSGLRTAFRVWLRERVPAVRQSGIVRKVDSGVEKGGSAGLSNLSIRHTTLRKATISATSAFDPARSSRTPAASSSPTVPRPCTAGRACARSRSRRAGRGRTSRDDVRHLGTHGRLAFREGRGQGGTRGRPRPVRLD
jgi:hypothetical protein